MERKVLCLHSKGEHGVNRASARHSEILADGLLLEVELYAAAFIRTYESYPEGRTVRTLATCLRLGCSYKLFHFGNKINGHDLAAPEVRRMWWLNKRVPILEPLSIHDQIVQIYAEGTGHIVHDMPPLDIEVRNHRRKSKAYQAEHPLVADTVRLPKYLIVTLTPTTVSEA